MHSPVRPVSIAPNDARVAYRADGTVLVQPCQALGPYPARATATLERWAAAAPGRTLLAERGGDGGWRRLTYAEALDGARRIGQALLDRRLSAERPVAILSGNGIEHLLLMLGALHVGVPVVPVSVAYSRIGGDFARLRACLDLVTPGLVFAADGNAFAGALATVRGAEIVTDGGGLPGATHWADLLAATPGPAVDAAAAWVGPDTLAKILFTSGSTGQPKGVITTHRMLCSNQAMILQSLPFLGEEPPVLLDWLPWNHVFGGNHDLGLVLHNGGTLYVDEGRPVPGSFGPTLRNLQDVSPTFYPNVPKGFEELARHLEDDPALCERFFGRVRMLFYAGAGLGQAAWDRMDRLALRTVGQRIAWMTGLGCTETAPFALRGRAGAVEAGVVGLPAPGVELKLALQDGKMEARVRGPNVTPGYWRAPAQTTAAFDEEGYYRTGDALAWADPDDPAAGLRFDGRVSEDFKLSSGTWVSAGPLRLRLLDALPGVQDLVLAGHDRDYLAALAIPAGPVDDSLQEAVAGALAAFAAQAGGSASRVVRLTFITASLSLDAGEITDKGSLNGAAVLRRHAALVEALYAEPPPPHVVCVREWVG